MTEFSKKELEALLKDTEEHLAETKRLGPGYYGIRERYDYAVEADERYIEKLKKQIADYDINTLNENQKIVLEWMKEDDDPNITVVLWQLTDDVLESQSMRVDIGEHVTAWKSLTDKQQFEVLQAFAEWGMKNEQ